MVNELTHQKKLELLMPWFTYIIESVKKDLKQEHLQNDRQFLKTYFGNKPIARITADELIQVYQKMVENNVENVCEFINVRWLLKHTDLYHFFETELTKINPNFDTLDVLEKEQGKALMDKAIHAFGPIQTYLFSILNTVVFPQDQLQQLRELSVAELSRKNEQEEALQEKATLDELKVKHDLEIQRMTDKYEKKLSGLQKKYLQDTEALKKNISHLQRKLQDATK